MKHGVLNIDSSLKRIAWAYGCSPKGSEEEAEIRSLLVRKVLREDTSDTAQDSPKVE